MIIPGCLCQLLALLLIISSAQYLHSAPSPGTLGEIFHQQISVPVVKALIMVQVGKHRNSAGSQDCLAGSVKA